MSIGENIKKFRKKSGLTQFALAEKANISRSYLADVEKNRYNVSLDVLGKIAKALNISNSALLGEDEVMAQVELSILDRKGKILKLLKSLTNDEGYFFGNLRKEIFDTFSELDITSVSGLHMTAFRFDYMNNYFQNPEEVPDDEVGQIIDEFNELFNYRTFKKALESRYNDIYSILESLEAIASKHNFEDIPSHQTEIPLLGSIAAGQPIDRIEFIEGYELVETSTLRGREAFALRVKGDSMIGDGIFDGDRVIAISQPEVTSSDIAVVAVNGDVATLKRVKCEGDMCMLIPSNPAIQPQLVPANRVHILGKVIQSRRSFE